MNKKSARQIAFEILLKIHNDKAYSNIVLDSCLQNENISQRDKGLVSFLVYGVIERQITLDYNMSLYLKQPIKKLKPEVLTALRLGAMQLLFSDKIPASAAINESVNLVKHNRSSFASGLVNAVLRNISKSGLCLPKDNEKNYLSVKYSCPNQLIDMWIEKYGNENTLEILTHSLGSVPVYLRVNTLKTTCDDLISALKQEGIEAEKCSFIDNALVLHNQGGIEKLNSFHDGLFHVEDLSSQLCCKLLNAKKGDTVYDVCAAPGGKSFTIAEYMENSGELKSFDIYSSRLKLIEDGAKRLGISCINTDVGDASVFDERRGLADKVLCDVPCSGLGIIRRKPEIKYKSLEDIDKLHNLQYLILWHTAKYVKTGGTLVYSTCSLNPKENIDVCKKFLSENDDFESVPIENAESYGFVDNNTLTLMPALNNTDGFFIAVFKKKM